MNKLEEKKPLVLQFEDGTELDLREFMSDEMRSQMKELGFPVDEGGRFSMRQLPIELKSEVEQREERARIAADYIKTRVLPQGDPLLRAISTDSASFGASVPTELANEILEKRDKASVLRGRAFSFNLPGKFDLPVEGVAVTGFWVAENATVTESNPTLVKKSLDDHYLAARVLIPYKLIDTSPLNIVSYVARLTGRKLAEQEETAFIGGSGNGQPRGIRQETVGTVTRNQSIGLHRDLRRLYFALRKAYRQNAVFITAPGGMQEIVSMEDDAKRPIFPPAETLDVLYRKPLLESEDIPENLGAGGDETEVWFGDPFYYWIKDGEMRMESDRVISKLQVELVTSMAVDGTTVLTDAWKKLVGVKVTSGS